MGGSSSTGDARPPSTDRGAATHAGAPGEAAMPGTPVDERTSRLAELVTSLTGCPPSGALHVLRTDEEPADDALELVARAIIRVDAPPDPSLRIVGDLRTTDQALPNDGPSGAVTGSSAQDRGGRPSPAGAGSAGDAAPGTSTSTDPSGAGAGDGGDAGPGDDDRWRRAPWLDASRASDDRRRDGRDDGPSAASTS